MSFEEQFPSLKDELWSCKDIFIQHEEDEGVVFGDEQDRIENWIFLEKHQVVMNCFDKQKVREAIIKHDVCIDKCQWNEESCTHQIWKELGL
jgi:hypothetical protein